VRGSSNVGHQPGVREGTQALAADLLPVAGEWVLAHPPFEKGAGIDAGAEEVRCAPAACRLVACAL
jgi:hypothetical protein